MKIDLNNCFPLSENTNTRGPLPKQREFLQTALDPKGPKYVLYAGGVGSGKSLIGCITVLSMAVQYAGDYLIARLFLPELKITTYKTFLDICPKELILEHRIADGIIRIKSATGVANIIFRGLDEPEKHRSLNLNAVYIDESSQVSEAAFVLLQTRLRGKYMRKMILTTNVQGHDWQHKLWVSQIDLTEPAKKQFKLIEAPSTENVHLPEGYIDSMMMTWSQDKIDREINAKWDSFAGQIYSEFSRVVHVIPPFQIPPNWTMVAGADHGFTNPAAWVFGAVDYDENLYIYDEFYEKEWLIEEICKGNKRQNKPGIIQKTKGIKLESAHIDPATRATRGNTGLSDWDTYLEHLPRDFPLKLANNKVNAGIDRVKSFMKVNPISKKPKIFIFNTCMNLIEEIGKYRWKELSVGQIGNHNLPEEPVKKDDHLADALRYLVMSRPEPPKDELDVYKNIKFNSLQGAIYRDLKQLKNGSKGGDPFSE